MFDHLDLKKDEILILEAKIHDLGVENEDSKAKIHDLGVENEDLKAKSVSEIKNVSSKPSSLQQARFSRLKEEVETLTSNKLKVEAALTQANATIQSLTKEDDTSGINPWKSGNSEENEELAELRSQLEVSIRRENTSEIEMESLLTELQEVTSPNP